MESTDPVRPRGAQLTPRERRPKCRHCASRCPEPLRIVETLASSHQIYVEPFGGIDSLLLCKPRSPLEIYNDTNRDVANLLLVMRDPLSLVRLIERLRWTEPATDSAGQRDDPIELALRVLLRSWTAMRSARANRWAVRAGAGNIAQRPALPLPPDWAAVPEALRSIAARLAGVIIESRDPLQVIADYDSPQTLFYIAPPAVGEVDCPFTAVSAGAPRANANDAALAATLARIRGQAILCGRDGGWLRQLYPEWRAVPGHNRAASACRPERLFYLSPGPDGIHRVATVGREES